MTANNQLLSERTLAKVAPLSCDSFIWLMNAGSAQHLFELARSAVSIVEIRDFSPSDPGYGSYVEVWSQLLWSPGPPKDPSFELSEVIGLTGWVNPEVSGDPERFRRYRRFTTAVALGLFVWGNSPDVVRPANYVVRDVIEDIDGTDQVYQKTLLDVLAEARLVLRDSAEAEYPFFTFGMIVLSQRMGDYVTAERLAKQLIDDDAEVRSSERVASMVTDERFVLGLTRHDQMHADWIRIATRLENPNGSEEIELVQHGITSDSA